MWSVTSLCLALTRWFTIWLQRNTYQLKITSWLHIQVQPLVKALLPVLWKDMQLSQCFSPPRFCKWIASITVRVSQQNDKGGGEVGISSIELASIPSEGMNTFPWFIHASKAKISSHSMGYLASQMQSILSLYHCSKWVHGRHALSGNILHKTITELKFVPQTCLQCFLAHYRTTSCTECTAQQMLGHELHNTCRYNWSIL